MKLALLAASLVLTGFASTTLRAPQATPKPTVASYAALADAILALHRAEEEAVRAMLDAHFQAARGYREHAMHEQAAAEMALFAPRATTRSAAFARSSSTAASTTTRPARRRASSTRATCWSRRRTRRACSPPRRAMRAAKDDAAREKAWKDFSALAEPLLAKE